MMLCEGYMDVISMHQAGLYERGRIAGNGADRASMRRF